MSNRLKVLIEAYECSPCRSHAAGAVWQIIKRLSKWHDIWVITEARYENEIVEYQKKNGEKIEGINFKYISRLPRVNVKGKRAILPIHTVLHYRKWLKKSYMIAADLHSRNNYDIVHHLRSNSFREPGYLWKLGVPFVWGPTGGPNGVPFYFLMSMGCREAMLHLMRNLVSYCQFRFSPRILSAVKKSAVIIPQTCAAQKSFVHVHKANTKLVHEQGTESYSNFEYRIFNGRRKLKIAWAGRCIGLKGLPILIRALGHHRIRNKVELHVAGDGPQIKNWLTMAKNLGLENEFIWHKWLSQDDLNILLSVCDLLAFPSLLEGTPATLMKSLSIGLPVICFAHCGFEDIIDATCGYSIPVTNIPMAIKQFQEKIINILENPSLIETFSRGAYERSMIFSWDSIANNIKDIYEDSCCS